MDIEIQKAKRAGNIIQCLHLLQRSENLNIKSVMDLGATPEQFAELDEFDLPDDTSALRLAALYNHAHTQGMGILHADMSHIMGVDEAQIILMFGITRFDYWKGRVMKININEDFGSQLYDRDNGLGAYMNALECKGCARCSDG